MKFGQWLKQEREARDWSQEELGERMGVKHSTISRLETGKTGVSEKMALRCADALAACLLPTQSRESVYHGARLARAGVEEKKLTVTDAGGRTWSVVARLGDPASPFVLSHEAAKVLAAIGVLGEPTSEPPAVPGDEVEDTEGEARA